MIEQNLLKNGYETTSAILKERLNACETAEIFATQNVSSISKAHMIKLLAATPDVEWPPVFQVKIADHYLRHYILEPLEQSVKGKTSSQPIVSMKELVRFLAIASQEHGAQSFVPSKPSFTAIFHGLTGSQPGGAKKPAVAGAGDAAGSGADEALTMLMSIDSPTPPAAKAKEDDQSCEIILHSCQARSFQYELSQWMGGMGWDGEQFWFTFLYQCQFIILTLHHRT